MRIDREQSLAVIHVALDEGVTFFDTADVYSGGTSEERLAEALGPRRDEVVLATKFGWYEGAAATTARAAFEGSLRRLRTDHVDVLYCHRPDPTVPLEETLGFMGELVAAGQVRGIRVLQRDRGRRGGVGVDRRPPRGCAGRRASRTSTTWCSASPSRT